jgi:hypothetical protein
MKNKSRVLPRKKIDAVGRKKRLGRCREEG